MFDSSTLLPPEYNLARANEERAKAAACATPGERRRYLEMAAIFEWRAGTWNDDAAAA